MVSLISLFVGMMFATAAGSETKPPNIIFILVDDMGWTGLSRQLDPGIAESCSDFYQTPRLDQLADRGTCFSNAYAPAPMCSPSRASILTGKSPAQLHMTTPGRGGKAETWQKVAQPRHITDLPEAEITLPELLKQQGYATAHFGKWHLNGGGPGKHGFDVHDGDTGNNAPESASNPKDMFGITTRAIDFIRARSKGDTPFYLQLSHYAVHAPVSALTSTREKFSKLPAGKRHQNADYAAMTADFDSSVGKMLDLIDELGITRNTYVIFTSDNGAASPGRNQENAPLSGGKGSLWEGGVRVPMIIAGPNVPAKVRRQEMVIGSDLFATVAEWAGVKAPLPKGVEGVSLQPLLSSGGAKVQRPENALYFHYPHYGKGPKQVPQSAIRVGNDKLILDYESGKPKLFDLTNDIGESNDLSQSQPEKAAKMHAMLTSYLREIHAQMPSPNPAYDAAAKPQNQRGPGGNRGFLSRFDQNNDGKVSREEFTGPPPRFNHLDSNNDGVISGDEIPR